MKNAVLFSGAALLLLAACSADRVLPTDPGTSGRTNGLSYDVTTTATGAGPMVSGLSSSMCADVWQASRTLGAAVVAYGCHGGANQQFALQPSGAITAYDGALCLDVWQAKANDGDPVVVYTCNGGANQKWSRSAAGELRTAVNGKCLDLWGAQAINGSKLAVYTCHGGANQKWTVQDATGGTPAPVTPAASDTAVGGSAELPRVSMATAMPARTGNVINVGAGGDLQAALDAAQPGDEVVLAPGATYVGNFVLRAKPGMTGTQWITVRTGGSLPAEGTRVGPADAAQMPKVLTPNVASAIKTDPAAQGWRLVGLEVGLAPGLPWAYSLVTFGSSGPEQTTLAQVPSRLVLDRSYVHASPSTDIRRCVILNSAVTAIIDSYLSECHSRDSESQGILGWNGPGPFKIVNNRIEGGHENIAFGGADPTVPGLIPSDVEIRRNHVIKPISWRGVWPAKNLVEIKAGQRMLMEGNVFENNWVDAQSGFAFVWWSANADGNALWSITQDITFRYNRVKNVFSAFNISDRYYAALPRSRRYTLANNVITGLDGTPVSRLYMITGVVNGVTISNNSGVASWYDLIVTEAAGGLPDLVFRNNVTGSPYSMYTSGGWGDAFLSILGLPASSVAGNVIAAGQGSTGVPTGNTYASSPAAVGFANYAGSDLTLSVSSPYRTSGTGGSMPGADMATVTAKTAGVVR